VDRGIMYDPEKGCTKFGVEKKSLVEQTDIYSTSRNAVILSSGCLPICSWGIS